MSWVRASPRRELTVAVLVCALGAALALVASGRVWMVEVTARPAPLPDVYTDRTGGALTPWLPALAWVALAGAGALLATRAIVRRLVGGLLVLAGVGGCVAAGWGVVDAGAGLGWPMLGAAGGLAVAASGAATLARAGGWPVMGARYERAGRARPRASPSERRPESVWDALDRGEDPTG